MTAERILDRAKSLGLRLEVVGDKVRVYPGGSPADFLDDLRRHKLKIVEYLQHSAQYEDGVEPYILRVWREASIPQWRRILNEAMRSGDAEREQYARWMLSDVLLDPDYHTSEGNSPQ